MCVCVSPQRTVPSLASSPVADPAAIVVAGNVRLSILTDRLVRVELSASKAAPYLFDDRPSLAVVSPQ